MDGRRKASAGRQVSFRRRPLPFCLVLGAGLLYASLAQALQSATPIFHTVREVHTLSAEEAARHYPVHLDHAQITYFQPSFGALFLMDRTDGIYANFNRGEEPAVMAGDIVAVDGVTGPGDVAPVLLRAHFRVLGHAPLPAAPTVSFDRLGTGGFDSRWVGVEGIVRSVDRPRRRTNYDGHTTFDNNNVVMTLASGDQRLEVIILDRGPWDPGRLVDAKVRVRGAIGSRFNQRNQLIGVHLYMPSPSCIDVLEAAPEDPFARHLTGFTAITRMGAEEPRPPGSHPRGGHFSIRWPAFIGDGFGARDLRHYRKPDNRWARRPGRRLRLPFDRRLYRCSGQRSGSAHGHCSPAHSGTADSVAGHGRLTRCGAH
ncbi:MAG TPA: hypothetical protein VGF88_21435 [Acidobacteriaceae bacterium]|jgi:hypothetical protein